MRCRLGAVHTASQHLLLQLFFASTSLFFYTAVLLPCGLSGCSLPLDTHTNTHRQALISDSNFTSSPLCLTHSLRLRQSSPMCRLLCHFFFSSSSGGRFLWDKCHVMLYGYITSVSSVWLCVYVWANVCSQCATDVTHTQITSLTLTRPLNASRASRVTRFHLETTDRHNPKAPRVGRYGLTLRLHNEGKTASQVEFIMTTKIAQLTYDQKGADFSPTKWKWTTLILYHHCNAGKARWLKDFLRVFYFPLVTTLPKSDFNVADSCFLIFKIAMEDWSGIFQLGCLCWSAPVYKTINGKLCTSLSIQQPLELCLFSISFVLFSLVNILHSNIHTPQFTLLITLT